MHAPNRLLPPPQRKRKWIRATVECHLVLSTREECVPEQYIIYNNGTILFILPSDLFIT